MSKRFLIVCTIIVAALVFAALRSPVRAQDGVTAVICAPCDGSVFGLNAGEGMALMSASGQIYFYPTHPVYEGKQRVPTRQPIKVGDIRFLGEPLQWAPLSQ